MRAAIALFGCAVLLASCSAAPPAAGPSPAPSASASPDAAASPTPFSAPSDAPPPSPLPSDAVATPAPTPGPPEIPPGSTPFPTPGPTITPGSTRVVGTIVHPDGSPAVGVCVVLEKGICPIATDDQGIWFTDIPTGPLNWNFIYRRNGTDVGRQFVLGTSGGELRLPRYTIAE